MAEKIIPIFILTLLLVVGVGWVKNILKLTGCDFQTPVKCEVIHFILLLSINCK